MSFPPRARLWHGSSRCPSGLSSAGCLRVYIWTSVRFHSTCTLVTCCSQLMSSPAPCPDVLNSSKISRTPSSLTSPRLFFSSWFYPNQVPIQDHTLCLVVMFFKSVLISTACLSPPRSWSQHFWGKIPIVPLSGLQGFLCTPWGFFFLSQHFL